MFTYTYKISGRSKWALLSDQVRDLGLCNKNSLSSRVLLCSMPFHYLRRSFSFCSSDNSSSLSFSLSGSLR